MNQRRSALRLSMISSLVALLAPLGCAADGAPSDLETTAESSEDLVLLAGAKMPSKVSVCWTNIPNPDTAAHESGRRLTREAVERTWQLHSSLETTWRDRCIGSENVRITVTDTDDPATAINEANPRTGWVGNNTVDVYLNFTFGAFSPACATANTRAFCIRAIAVHEFGHALGFAHEQNRADAPPSCAIGGAIPGATNLGAYDPESVMNYCNPVWSNSGRLSALDISGLQSTYGLPSASNATPHAGFEKIYEVPGCPFQDLAVDGAGIIWALDCAGVIREWVSPTQYGPLPGPGRGTSIAVQRTAGSWSFPSVIGGDGRVYHFSGVGWDLLAPEGGGTDLAIDLDGTHYVASGFRNYRLNRGTAPPSWSLVSSAGGGNPMAVRAGHLSVIGGDGGVYQHMGGQVWARAGAGAGKQIAVSRPTATAATSNYSTIWVIGMDDRVYYYTIDPLVAGGVWNLYDSLGRGRRVATSDDGVPYVIGFDGAIYRGRYPAQLFE